MLALLLHWGLLGSVAPALDSPPAAPHEAVVRVAVRSVLPGEAPKPMPDEALDVPGPAPTPVAKPAFKPPRRLTQAAPELTSESFPTRVAESTPTPQAASAEEAPQPAPTIVLAQATPASTTTAAAATSSAAEAAPPPPVYRTQLPPPLTLHYALSRGELSGEGELVWRPAQGRYVLDLAGRVLGLNVLLQHSEGELDTHGIAPLRFTDQRLRRAALASNFQRDKGLVTFSGPHAQLRLHPGVQDRLSWMVQLAAIVAADPAHTKPGAEIVLEVIGTNGEASSWAFQTVAMERIATPLGTLEALHLRREPRREHDTAVDVWLDPTRHHVPVRAIMDSSGRDGRFDLRLKEMVTP